MKKNKFVWKLKKRSEIGWKFKALSKVERGGLISRKKSVDTVDNL